VLTGFGCLHPGDVKGTIRSVLRCLVISIDVRRHRLISISYISLLPCHGSGLKVVRISTAKNVRALSGLPRKKKCGGARSCGRGSFDRVV